MFKSTPFCTKSRSDLRVIIENMEAMLENEKKNVVIAREILDDVNSLHIKQNLGGRLEKALKTVEKLERKIFDDSEKEAPFRITYLENHCKELERRVMDNETSARHDIKMLKSECAQLMEDAEHSEGWEEGIEMRDEEILEARRDGQVFKNEVTVLTAGMAKQRTIIQELRKKLSNALLSKDRYRSAGRIAQDDANESALGKRKAEAVVGELIKEAQELDKKLHLEEYKTEFNAKAVRRILKLSPEQFAALHGRIQGTGVDEGFVAK